MLSPVLRVAGSVGLAMAAAVLLGGTVSLPPQRGPSGNLVTTQGALPQGSDMVGPLRRGANGQIESVDPTKESGVAPRACSAGAVCVGARQAYPTLADALKAARPGAVIEVAAGTYRGATTVTLADVTIRGVGGRPHFDCAGLPLAGDKACLLLAANHVTLENLEISGAAISDSLGANGACIRNEPNLDFTLREVICHGSQDGLLTNGGAVVIERSQFYDNGWTGQTHNVYFSGACTSVTVRGSIFRDARIGHEFKSRCRRTEIADSTFRSERGSRNLDIPDGGETMVYRSTLVKSGHGDSQQIVGFTPESCKYPGTMTLKDVKIVNSRPDAEIQNFDNCPGKAIVMEGIALEGLPFKELGYIIHR